MSVLNCFTKVPQGVLVERSLQVSIHQMLSRIIVVQDDFGCHKYFF